MKKIPLLLLCLWAQMAWAQEPVPMDTTQIKLLVRLACPCFKDMAQIFPEKLTDDQLTSSDIDKKVVDGMRRNFQCVMDEMRNHKKELGMEHIPDSLLEVGETMGARPPAFLRNVPMSSILYAVRDCPYLFKGLTAAIDFAQIMQKKQAERWATIQKDSVITEAQPAEPEFYDNGYQKRFKGKLKGMESKNMPTLVIERMIDGKKVTDKPVILYQLSEGEDMLRDLSPYKGKDIIVETSPAQLFNTKTKQFEQYWYVRSIIVAK